ncbi:MAG TPA: response regulator transcription factor [Telluria sp.]|jgi:DNA-binding NarL/FixJ family response regulator
MINILLGSSLFLMREGVRRIVAPHKEMRVVAEAVCGEDVLMSDQSCHVAVLVHPLHFSGDDDFYSRLQREKPGMQIIIIANNIRPEYVSSLLRTGARGVLGRNFSKEHLLDAIRTVASGKPYVGAEVSSLIASRMKLFRALSTRECLTQREIEILKRLAIGRKTATIGFELGISSKTVSAHKANIMNKLALTSYSQLVYYAIENRMFDLFVDHSNRKRERVT